MNYNPAIIFLLCAGFLATLTLGYFFHKGQEENPPWMAVVGSTSVVLALAAIVGVIYAIGKMCYASMP
jgi:heme/copper-type cytochrome/quinol oxidase subunit 4